MMKAIVCEMCGSQDLVKQDGMYVCQNCGTKYTVEEAKKLMIEGTVDVSGSTVKVDSSDELTNLYQIARRAKDNNNSENAAKYYDMILVKDPESWEAQFYTVYYQTMQCKIAEIPNASANLANCMSNVISLIKKHVSDIPDQISALTEIYGKCTDIALMLFKGVWSSFQPNGYYNNPAYFRPKCYPIIAIFSQQRKAISSEFGTDEPFAKVISFARRSEIDIRKALAKRSATQDDVNAVNALIAEEKAYDSSYGEEVIQMNTKSGGCYVATAVYGSYDCPQVWTLRRYRDYTLAESWYGRAFIHTYYTISPTLVKWFGKTEWFKNLWKPKLDRMVERLNSNGVEDTPYSDRNW